MIELEVLRTVALQAAGEPGPRRWRRSPAPSRSPSRTAGSASSSTRRQPSSGPLRELAQQQPRSGYLRELVAATSGGDAATAATYGRRRSGRARAASLTDELLDPLSDRELDVLRLLRSDLDGPAIARELVVSLNTVRTHTKHIYTKLGVNNRRAAVSRAHQLGLLSRRRPLKITTALTR